MSNLKEILKKLKEARNMSVGEDEEKRIRITIKNGKMDVAVEAVPDLDALSVERLYALRDEYSEQIAALEDEEPDEEAEPEAYGIWEDEIERFQQDLDEIEEKIEERTEE